ncbi:MAG TPA: hypothetical protein VIV12_12470 [Streptosporangiaceae bacterium]
MAGKEVQLRNGGMVFEPAILVTAYSVRDLMEKDPIAFWELVEVCRKPDHQIFSSVQAQVLVARSLLVPVRTADGAIDLARSKPHQIIRDVVCSMVEGELPHVRLVSPLPSAEARPE